ncbi:hypothetical protein KIS4809_4484 [Bacillus sp. ZZV12-4809]|nr:hypothetical protein KIS4809_4484 [Bacillus sp. ZZV12-4809]
MVLNRCFRNRPSHLGAKSRDRSANLKANPYRKTIGLTATITGGSHE